MENIRTVSHMKGLKVGKALRETVGKLSSNFLLNMLFSHNTEHVFQRKRSRLIIWYMDACC